MSDDALLEALLARVYADADECAAFAVDPEGCARRAGLSEAVVARVARLDRVGLQLAARSFSRKRAHRLAHERARHWLARVVRRLRG